MDMMKTGLAVIVMVFVAASALLVDAVMRTTAINEAEAKAIAIQTIEGTVSEVEFDATRGTYEVEVQNEAEHEVKVDAQTGAVISTSSKITEDSAQQVTSSQAIDIAREHAEGSFDEIEQERENGRNIFAVSFKNGSKDTEVKVDSKTGEVLSVEIEYEDEDE